MRTTISGVLGGAFASDEIHRANRRQPGSFHPARARLRSKPRRSQRPQSLRVATTNPKGDK